MAGPHTITDSQAVASGQVTRRAAEIYEEFFVPALFRGWAPKVAEAAHLAPGEAVLDVACGTGVLAREAAKRVVPGGSVTGLDRNEGMLAVAQSKAPDIDWRHGLAESLPFASGTFDAVVSQFGLMFFEDRIASLREMWRVLRPGGRLAVAVWDALDQSPGYAAMTALLQGSSGIVPPMHSARRSTSVTGPCCSRCLQELAFSAPRSGHSPVPPAFPPLQPGCTRM